ncbi:Peroxiredoxin [Fodinibius salinus]|uniref:Peroxiredoxin n=1 Tax=Fodinibius salinus TaxID=860790 RepID=A0A5D3YPQ8_9BACT|nr:redoxin domain-containing protein [Fodinibius salinus]TYP95228.1 Peroxiredoxin [Fodinibius salinus]
MTLDLDTKAPDFTLKNTDGEDVSLSGFQPDYNVVLLFFPLAFSSTCTEELCITRDNMKLYNSLDAKVLGISVDSFFSLKQFKKTQNLNFTLLSDFNKEVSRKYDALYDNFFEMKGVSKRASFVIDREGKIRYQEVLEDAGKLPDFKKIQEMLNSLD